MNRVQNSTAVHYLAAAAGFAPKTSRRGKDTQTLGVCHRLSGERRKKKNGKVTKEEVRCKGESAVDGNMICGKAALYKRPSPQLTGANPDRYDWSQR